MRDHILEVDQNGDTVDYWDLPKILDPYRDDVILAMDQGAVCLSVDAEHSGQVMTKEQLAKQPFGDIAGSGPGATGRMLTPSATILATTALSLARATSLPSSKLAAIKSEMDTFRSIRLERRTGEKVLKPVDSNGKPLTCEAHHCDGGFDWTWTQHTGWLVPSKSTGGKTVVTAFDNGDARGMEQPAMPSMKYSRGVEYQIDEKYDGFPNVGIW